MAEVPRPLPAATPETQEFFDGLRRRELRLQRCRGCGRAYFYPRPFCPRPGCHSRDVEWFTASGRGTLYSYVIAHRGHPAFEAPYVIAVVELEEGARLMTNIVGLAEPAPEALPAGAPVEVVYEDVGDEATLPLFRLTTTGGA